MWATKGLSQRFFSQIKKKAINHFFERTLVSSCGERNSWFLMFIQVSSVQISDVYWKLITVKRKADQYAYGENSSFALHSFVTATDNSRKTGARHIRTFISVQLNDPL